MINWAYVAGFLDGEGTVECRNRRVNIFQKDPKVLYAIQRFLEREGLKTTIGHRSDRVHNNLGYLCEQYHLHIVDKPSVEKFLSHVRPYIIVKKQLVEDVWRYLRLFPRLPHERTGALSSISDKHVSRTHKGKKWIGHGNQYSKRGKKAQFK